MNKKYATASLVGLSLAGSTGVAYYSFSYLADENYEELFQDAKKNHKRFN